MTILIIVDMSIPFQIQLKPHVKKYFSYFNQEPYTLNRKDMFGKWLYYALRDQHNEEKYNDRLQAYTNKLTILVGRNYVFNNRITGISAQATIDINNWIDELIKNQFTAHMLSHIDTDTYQDSIEKFRKIYDFTEDDLKFDCLKQHWFRFRKENGIIRDQSFVKNVVKL